MAGDLAIIVKDNDCIQGLSKIAIVLIDEIASTIDKDLKVMIEIVKEALLLILLKFFVDIIDDGIIIMQRFSQSKSLADLVYRRISVRVKVTNELLLCVVKEMGNIFNHPDPYRSILNKK
jgi:actin-like ATPase involved in cell morphogenesis